LAKKRKVLKKPNHKQKSKRTRNKNNKDNKVRIYKVNQATLEEQAKARREKNIQTFLVVVIIILAIAAIFSAIQTFFPNLFGRITLKGELAAKVNGVPITMQRLDTEYERLPAQYKYFITKEAFLNQLIDEILMVEEARKKGLFVSEEEVDKSLQTFMEQNNISQERLNDILKAKKLTYNELRQLVSNQRLIDKLLEEEVKNKINITTAMALQYYNENPDTFKIPELVTARHILISTNNRTEKEAYQQARIVLGLLEEDKSNFCDLVEEYSDDSGSLDKCGEYVFPRGQMVKEFEEAAFSQGEGNITLVNTSFGSHIIWTINKTPEQIMRFQDVEEQINRILRTQQEKMLYSDFIAGLRAQADITNYLVQEQKEEAEAKEEGTPGEEGGVVAAEQGEIKVVMEEQGEEEEVTPREAIEEEAVEEVEEGVDVMMPEEEVAEEQQELEETVEKEIAEIEEVTAKLSLAECLTSKGAVLYGAYWDSSTKKQKASFGDDIDKIKYVECGVEGDYRAQTIECSEAGIMAYPTWVINNEKHMGVLTYEELAALTGCEI